MQANARRTDIKFRQTEARLDATRAQLDHMRLQLSGQITQTRADVGRLVLLGVLGSVVATAGLCLGTLVLLL
jgi:hypothetical protein